MIFPWFTVRYIGKKSFIRFLPATIIISLVVRLENILAHKYEWWSWKKKLHPRVWGELPVNLGLFFVSAIWILKWTYGNLLKYLLLNFTTHVLYATKIVDLAEDKEYVSLKKLNKLQFFLLFELKSLILYGIQWSVDKIRTNK